MENKTHTEQKKGKRKQNKNTTIILVVAILLFIAVAINAYISSDFSFSKNNNTSEKEVAQIDNPEIEITYITPQDCEDCTDITILSSIIAKNNGNVVNVKELKETDQEAIDLIAKYELKKLPGAIIKGEIKKDDTLYQTLLKIGDDVDGQIIVTQVAPPYKNLEDGKIRGVVNLKLLSDRTCEECYDPTVHEKVLSNYGINPKTTEVLDVNSGEGKKLVNKYNITLVPTFVLTGDVEPYESLKNIWPNVGAQFDNTLVFTKGVKQMGIYKDLKTGKIIKPEKKPTPVATPQNTTDAPDTSTTK